jgi:hypothetical protein
MFRSFSALLIGLSLFLAPFSLHAQDAGRARNAVATDMGMDHFAAGENVTVSAPVAGDLLAAGRAVACDGNVGGDAVLAGGTVQMNCVVAQNAYAAGGDVTVDGTVSHNARVAGGNVQVAPAARINGGLTVAAGNTHMNGTVGDYLQAAGGTLFIDGSVGGNVEASVSQLELGPKALIMGRLRYRSPNELRQDPAARVLGGIEYIPTRQGVSRARGLARFLFFLFFVWTLGLIVLVTVLILLMPRLIGGVVQTLESRPGVSVLLGFALLICIPVASLILLITLVGAPLALVVMAAYCVLLIVGYVVTGAAVGDWLWKRMRRAATTTGPRVLAAIVGIIILTVLGSIPVLGSLVVFAALLFGLGALGLRIYQALRPAPQPPPAQT